jgi:hypothetical protein
MDILDMLLVSRTMRGFGLPPEGVYDIVLYRGELAAVIETSSPFYISNQKGLFGFLSEEERASRIHEALLNRMPAKQLFELQEYASVFGKISAIKKLQNQFPMLGLKDLKIAVEKLCFVFGQEGL